MIVIRHLLTKVCDWIGRPALIAVLVGLLAVQVAVPPQLSGFVSQENWQEFDEQEDSEPGESNGEQSLPEFAGAASFRPQRAESRFIQRITPFAAPRARKALGDFLTAAEMAHRNGTGGPLRC